MLRIYDGSSGPEQTQGTFKCTGLILEVLQICPREVKTTYGTSSATEEFERYRSQTKGYCGRYNTEQWHQVYSGIFPHLRKVLRGALGSAAYEEGNIRLQAIMRAKTWSYRWRKRTIELLRELVRIEKEQPAVEYSYRRVPCNSRRLIS